MGRPTKFDPAFCDQARKLCRLGATDIEIADFFAVDVRTLYRWKNDNDEFCQALKEAKTEADARVEASLYHRATGYTFDAIKIFNGAEGVVKVPYREHVPPDPTSMIFWLKNRQADKWRDKQVQTFETADGQALVPVLNVIERPDDRSGAAPKAVNGSKLNGH